MYNYVLAGLCAALLLLGWLYRGEVGRHAQTSAALSAAAAVNAAHQAEIARLERGMEITDRILADWNQDRTTLAGVRGATRQAIKEAMRDETFKAWASSPAPEHAFRLLRATPDPNGNGSSAPARGAARGLPGDPDPGKRQ